MSRTRGVLNRLAAPAPRSAVVTPLSRRRTAPDWPPRPLRLPRPCQPVVPDIPRKPQSDKRASGIGRNEPSHGQGRQRPYSNAAPIVFKV